MFLNDFGKIQNRDRLDDTVKKDFNTAYNFVDGTRPKHDSLYIDTSTKINTAASVNKLNLGINIQEYKRVKRRKPLSHNFQYSSGTRHRDDREGVRKDSDSEEDWLMNDRSEEDELYDKWPNRMPIGGLRQQVGIGSEEEPQGSVEDLYSSNKWESSQSSSKDRVASRSDSQLGGESNADYYENFDGVHSTPTQYNNRRAFRTRNQHGWRPNSKKMRQSYTKRLKHGRNVNQRTKHNSMGTRNGRVKNGDMSNEWGSNADKSQDDKKNKKKLSLITFKKIDYNNNINNNNNAAGAINNNEINNGYGKSAQDKCTFIVCVAVYLNDAKLSPYGDMIQRQPGGPEAPLKLSQSNDVVHTTSGY